MIVFLLGGNVRRGTSSNSTYIMKKSTPKMVCSFSWRRTRDSTVYGAQKIIGCSSTNPRFFDRCTITASLFRPLDALGGNARRCSSSNSMSINKKNNSPPKRVDCYFGGGQEIRTLAPVSRPTPLAGEPLWPLE